MEKLYKWQEKFLAELKGMSNEELLEEVLILAAGDDYDGCYTNRGWWMYRKLKDELNNRLRACNFFGE